VALNKLCQLHTSSCSTALPGMAWPKFLFAIVRMEWGVVSLTFLQDYPGKTVKKLDDIRNVQWLMSTQSENFMYMDGSQLMPQFRKNNWDSMLLMSCTLKSSLQFCLLFTDELIFITYTTFNHISHNTINKL
jgi:hypothetical protein